MKKQIFILLLVVSSLVTPVLAIRPNYVYDWDDLLTDEQEAIINDYCAKVDENTTAEIVVITLADSEGRTQEEARLYYYNDYPLDGVKGIGKDGKDNGVLLIICLKDNFWGIEVGYGLEGDLTDSEAGRIGRDILVAKLKDGKDFEAINGTIKAIAKEIGYGKTTSEKTTDNNEQEFTEFSLVPFIILAILLIITVWVMSDSSDDDDDIFFGGGYSGGGGSSSGGGGGGFGGGGSGGGGAGGEIRKIPIMEQPIEDHSLKISMIAPFLLQLFCPSCLSNMLCVSIKKPYIETIQNNEHRVGDFVEYDEIRTQYIYGACLTCHETICKKTEISNESKRDYKPIPVYHHTSHRSSSYGGSSYGGFSGGFGGGHSGGAGAGGRIR